MSFCLVQSCGRHIVSFWSQKDVLVLFYFKECEHLKALFIFVAGHGQNIHSKNKEMVLIYLFIYFWLGYFTTTNKLYRHLSHREDPVNEKSLEGAVRGAERATLSFSNYSNARRLLDIWYLIMRTWNILETHGNVIPGKCVIIIFKLGWLF